MKPATSPGYNHLGEFFITRPKIESDWYRDSRSRAQTPVQCTNTADPSDDELLPTISPRQSAKRSSFVLITLQQHDL